jgi:hypothetical protein
MPLRRIGLAALLVATLVGVACTDDGEGARPRATTTSPSVPTTDVETTITTTTVEPGGPGPTAPGIDAEPVPDGRIGGSRFVARVEPDPDTEGGGRLIVEDRETDTERVVADRADATPGFPQVSADGEVVVWNEGTADGETSTVLIRTGTTLEVRADAPDIGCPRFMPDGRILATSYHGETARIALIDPATGAVEERPGDLVDPGCIAPAGPEHVIVPVVVGEPFGTGGVDLVRYPLADGHGEVVAHLPGGCSTNAITTDPGATQAAVSLYCEDTARNAIWVVDLGSGEARPLVAENDLDADHTTSSQYWDPVWSADGTMIAYQRVDPDPEGGRSTSHVWVADVATGTTALLTEQPAFAPGLSPAG